MIVIHLKGPGNIEERFELDKSIVTVGAPPDCDVPLSLVRSDKPALYIRKSKDHLLLHPCVAGIKARSGTALSLNVDEKVLPEEVYLLPGDYSLQAFIQVREVIMEANARVAVANPGHENKPKIEKTSNASGSTTGRLAAFALLGVAILSLAIGALLSNSVDSEETGDPAIDKKKIYEMFAKEPNDTGLALIRQAEMHAAIGGIDKAIDLYQEVLSSVGNSSPTGEAHALPLFRPFFYKRLSELLKLKRQSK